MALKRLRSRLLRPVTGANKMQRPEQELQRAMLTKLFREYPDSFVFHVPNGEKRTARDGYNLKLNGVKAGVPDLVVVRPHGQIGWIEVKAGSAISLAQKRVHHLWKKLRHDVYVISDINDLTLIIENWKKQDVGRILPTA